jgi:hypothetical protein
MIGISVYAGMEIDIEEILEYIEEAHNIGINLLFTSAHIPEVGEKFEEDFERILNLCNELGITTIVDISKDYFERLDLKRYKIDYIRLDYGFTLKEAALMTKEHGYGISVNATTFDEEQIERFIEYGGKLDKINACHNFYPRKDTGISEELFIEKNRIFKEYGIKTMAFISTQYRRRGPVYEGLPTLEMHRDINPIVSAQHLLKLGADFIVVGDAMASIEELKTLSSIKKDVTLLPIKLKDDISAVELSLLNHIHTNRIDPGECTIRSQESRLIKEGSILPNNNNMPRRKYSITIDNEEYNRYEGELQILKKDLNPDPRVNVVADGYESRILIESLQPGEKFKFQF